MARQKQAGSNAPAAPEAAPGVVAVVAPEAPAAAPEVTPEVTPEVAPVVTVKDSVAEPSKPKAAAKPKNVVELPNGVTIETF